MEYDDLYDIVAGTIFLLFVGMLFAISLSVAVRVGRWFLRAKQPPTLLYRDLVGFSGLSLSFLMVSAARASNIPPEYLRTIPWLIASSVPALSGLSVFLYFEFFVIGHDPD